MAYEPTGEISAAEAYGEPTTRHPAERLQEAIAYNEITGETTYPDRTPSGPRTWQRITNGVLQDFVRRMAAVF